MNIDDELSREFGYRAEIEQILDDNLHCIIDDGVKVMRLDKASHKQDTEEATDFIYHAGLKVPVRIRTPKYYRYKGEFTIRWRSACGQRTEIDKLSDGHGDVYFYAWTKIDSDNVEYIADWCLINLHKLRTRHNVSRNNSILFDRATKNGDNKTGFTYYHVREIGDCVINGSKNIMNMARRIRRMARIPIGKQGGFDFMSH